MANKTLESNTAALLSGVAITCATSVVAWAVASEKGRIGALALALVIGIGATLLARKFWLDELANRDFVGHWLRKSVAPMALLGFMVAVDFLLAVLFDPDTPPIQAATSHVGFVITLLFAPMAFAPVACALRAWMQAILNAKQ